MGKKLFISVVLCLAMSICTVFAQTRKVSGTVTDATTGEGVPAATVMIRGTHSGTSTDNEGQYSISVQTGAVLEFSSIGYVTASVKVGDSNVINVKLEVDKTMLEDAVVVGYGSARKISSIVGSVATVKSEIVKNSPSASALDQLQGQVAGLSVLTSSGVAGDNAVSMRLHGIGSLGTSSTPLYVVDGIPTSSRAVMAMNPNDIQSISVLKDASATSIYGSRAANGVLYISTKNGSYNEKATVTVRSQMGVNTLADDHLYTNMMSGEELIDFWIRSGLHSPEEIKASYIDQGYTANTKWYKELMNLNTLQTQNDVSIEGGGRKVAYMIGASQYHQEGFIPSNYYNRYTIRNNIQAHPLEWMKIGSNINLSIDKSRYNGNWGSSSGGAAYTYGGLAYLNNPLLPNTTNEDGTWYTALNLPVPSYYEKSRKSENYRYGFNGNFYVELEPIRNLKIVSRDGVDGYFGISKFQLYHIYTDIHGGTARTQKSNSFSYGATTTNTIEYSFTIAENHNFSILGGQEGVKNYYDYTFARADGQTDDRTMLLQQGTTASRQVSESHTESRFLSFFGHLSYDFANKYYLDATIRNDAVSRFGKDKRNATFWSAGAKWNMKKENFLKDVSWLDAADFKVSYGTQGNASIGDYPSLGLVTNSGVYNDVSARYVSQPANDNLTWENQALLTVGLSGKIFNRVDFDVEFYHRKTTDMLMDVPQPYTAGFTSVMQNVGGLRNAGIDVTAGVDILRTRKSFVRFSTTFNYNSEKVTELFDNRDRWVIANTTVAYVKGKPVMYYLPLWAGVNEETGAPMWYKAGDDVDKTTKEETTSTFDEDALTQNSGKRRYAPINGGFSFSGAFGNFSFQADFSYVLGKYMLNNDGYFYANPNSFATNNQNKMVSDFWTPYNTDAKFPDWSQGYRMEFDTHLLDNASFLRLKTLAIAYALPERWLAWSNNVLKMVKITFTGRNLLTFTGYDGIDPEVDSNVSYGITGNSKQYLGGIEITF
jgi:TonB-linked SusC/RagA family outer membrane protein